MGIFRRKSRHDLGEHAIFGDEEAAEMRAELSTVVGRLDDLTGRVNAQFTSMSAYAEISREQMSEVREEARADMERSRELLIGLIDRLRDERRDDVEASDATTSDPRLDDIELSLRTLADNLENCEMRQRQIAETMTAFIDTMLSQQVDEPIPGLAIA
jgi:hypothetical protein